MAKLSEVEVGEVWEVKVSGGLVACDVLALEERERPGRGGPGRKLKVVRLRSRRTGKVLERTGAGLRRRLASREDAPRYGRPAAKPTLDEALPEIQAALREGRRLAAAKRYREVTGASHEAAMEALDGMALPPQPSPLGGHAQAMATVRRADAAATREALEVTGAREEAAQQARDRAGALIPEGLPPEVGGPALRGPAAAPLPWAEPAPRPAVPDGLYSLDRLEAACWAARSADREAALALFQQASDLLLEQPELEQLRVEGGRIVLEVEVPAFPEDSDREAGDCL